MLATVPVRPHGPDTAVALAADAMVAAEHRLAAAAGAEMLRRGGNAVDAAIAAATTTGVVNPSSCGLGGGGFLLVYERRSGRAHVLDYRERAPAAAVPERFRDGDVVMAERAVRGPLAVAVPGEPAGLAAAHARFGSLPLEVVLGPAIRHAREGFRIEAHLAGAIAEREELLRADPALAATFLHPDGTPRREGEPLRQPELARSLETLARGGAEAFYRGPIAAAIAATLGERGGLLTANDLARYRPRWREPLRGRYRGRTVLTMPPPGSGGVVLTALNVLAAFDLAALELASPTYLHLVGETLKAVFADRARYYGDPDAVDVPVGRLLSAAHAGEIRRRLSAVRVAEPGAAAVPDAGTAHVSVVDDAGNAAACTTTINTAFGAGIVARGTGIILNNEMADFTLAPGAANVFGLVGATANLVAPDRRPLSSMSPTIVVRGGRPEVVVGASGGPTIISASLQTLLAVIDFGLPAAAAVALPRLHQQWTPDVLVVEPGLPDDVRARLQRVGHRVLPAGSLGAVSLVVLGADGVAAGAGDPRKGGAAVAP